MSIEKHSAIEQAKMKSLTEAMLVYMAEALETEDDDICVGCCSYELMTCLTITFVQNGILGPGTVMDAVAVGVRAAAEGPSAFNVVKRPERPHA